MDETFRVVLERTEGFGFRASFPDKPYEPYAFDEPAPLSGDTAPSATRALAATIGNCLSASLLLCLQKSRVDVTELRTEVEGRLARNEKGRWRIAGMRVRIQAPGVPEEKLARCRELFEDFCIVTQSVREGLAVDVEVDGSR